MLLDPSGRIIATADTLGRVMLLDASDMQVCEAALLRLSRLGKTRRLLRVVNPRFFVGFLCVGVYIVAVHPGTARVEGLSQCTAGVDFDPGYGSTL
jgi:hypothetical protein